MERVGFEFNLDQHRAIAAYLYAMYEEGADISIQELFKRVEDQELGQLLTDILMLQVNEELSEAELSDYVKSVELSKLVNDKEKKLQGRKPRGKRLYQSGDFGAGNC
ncbi:hypothetical protein PO124_17265 [Bacillus licheniformis]|nr:hypothetical protein [Bacillus licheniformis]